MANDFFSIFDKAGLDFSGLGSNVGTAINTFLIFVGIGIFIFIIWKLWDRKKYNIQIRGHDLRGNHDFEFDDKAREFISFNRAELKLLRRKKANVIIPDLKQYRSMVDGRRVIHVFKYGAVNDYVVLDPQIVMDMEEIPLMDKDGNPQKDKEGNELVIRRPKYELHITESLNKEHSIRDLRDALGRFGQKDALQKYGPIVAVIIIGVVIIATAWIYGIYMVKAGNLHLKAVNIATETLNKFLEYQHVTGGIT